MSLIVLSKIHILASGQLSPFKKMKRKVGYDSALSLDLGGDLDDKMPNKQLKYLCLSDKENIEMNSTLTD